MNEHPLDAFLFYRSYRESLNGMTQKDQLATLLAIIDYALYGVEPTLKAKMPAAVFTVARPIIDANNARRAGGKKGGRPKKKTIGFPDEETIGFENEKPDALYNEEMKNEKEPPNSPPRGKRERFTPPTVEDVAAFCLERKNGIDAEEFCAFYSSKGWRVGSSPMKDWRAAVLTWEKKRAKTEGPEPGHAKRGRLIVGEDGEEAAVFDG
ncbi:DUF6291 domain-containing protein [uncultured Oscillibacter sp.]|uniref:DUF6291 domain-containing protein n=1 Tax=uncultured Oscillibacter sp. TaxID=876091 RepID=UPI002617983F|nr:DUF6291 domain-containing protein [uncultured Oscillibacter sp.]